MTSEKWEEIKAQLDKGHYQVGRVVDNSNRKKDDNGQEDVALDIFDRITKPNDQ